MAYAPSSSSSSAAAYKSPPPTSSAPQGTFLPGTKVQVGSHRVVIEKYLSEGGFAHVYVVRVPRDGHKHELAVLKRVAVPDRSQLATMRTEVETMKKLQGHKHVVKYLDSHASQLKGGGYEVFLLMEYCAGGGLIDFMNTRLQHRLTEPEILKIFGDVAEGVACMHYLKPPLLHRDLKVENVLIAESSSSRSPVYKLCDFGSTAPPRPAAKTPEEGHLIEEDVQKNTTMQYRSPEMIDVWRKQPIDEKSDIWALGVLLYKLCYYTTPFENVGQMAILNASFKYPSHPSFSERLKRLIGNMLKEDPKQRLTIYQVIAEVCSMRGTEIPIKDIYAQRTHSEARRNESLPSPEPPMAIGLQKQAPQAAVQSVPDITPMRRGRPTTTTQSPAAFTAKAVPSPARGDPFVALDSKNYEVRVGAVDELSKKYPSLDEFSIAHEKGEAFSFSPQPPAKNLDATAPAQRGSLNERVMNALADQAFNQSTPATGAIRSNLALKADNVSSSPSISAGVKSPVQEVSKQAASATQPRAMKGVVTYKSTATGASPPPSTTKTQFPEIINRPIWRVPEHNRSSSQPRPVETRKEPQSASLEPSKPASKDLHRSKSQTATLNAPDLLTSTSSRPSLEGHRPSLTDVGGPMVRTKSAQFRQRPSSAYLASNMDYLRDQEQARKRPSGESRRHSKEDTHAPEVAVEESVIDDDMEYLRQSEDAERRTSQRQSVHRKHSHHHSHSISTGAKQILTGRFGDAFKRFERRSGDENLVETASAHPILQHEDDSRESRLLSAAVEPDDTHIIHSTTINSMEETEDLPPEVRRELERQRLAQEERRVAEATAEYRSHVAEQGTGGVSALPSRASTIQRRVQTLLDEAEQSLQPNKRTAEGYGRYTDSPGPDSQGPTPAPAVSKAIPPPLATKPIAISGMPSNPYPKTKPQPIESPTPAQFAPTPSASAPPLQTATVPLRVVSRPSVPPKAAALRTGGEGQPHWPPASTTPARRSPALKPSGGLAALLAKDLEGVPDYPPSGSSAPPTDNSSSVGGSGADATTHSDGAEDFESDFSRRYPSLSGIEMVETEIGGQRRVLKVRDV